MITLHKPRFRLRTILLIVNLFVLIVPIGSIYIFRLYENELVRQTESELIVQGAYIAALYKQTIVPHITDPKTYGTAAIPQARVDAIYRPIAPTLNLAGNTVAPVRPDAKVTKQLAEPAAIEAGKTLAPVLQEATLTTLAGIRLMDYQGIVVAGHEEVGMSLANTDEVAGALKGAYMAQLRERISKHPLPPLASISRGTRIRIFVAMPIINEQRVIGAVLLSRSPRNVLNGLYDDRHSVVMVVGIILSVAVLLALLTSHAISRPITALIGQAQRVARGEKGIKPIAEPVTVELALLSQTISDMAETIAERSDYIRNFAMHVSHEFKTPLTAIQGAIELIQEHGSSMPPEQLARFLANTMTDTDRLKRLVTRLLELARADVLEPLNESCALDGLLQDLQSDYRDKGMEMVSEGMYRATLPMPADIAHTVLGNLCENSRQQGATRMHMTLQRHEATMKLIVKDNGPGISPANRERLFTPFFTTKREQGGTGLGLVIVRSLLTAYGMQIAILDSDEGACFEISWSVQA